MQDRRLFIGVAVAALALVGVAMPEPIVLDAFGASLVFLGAHTIGLGA